MAESKGALIAKSVQKHAGRAKEKLLQNLGKVDRTLDDIFEEHLQNFNRQHQQATRLQKEFNNYIRCIRAVQTASKSLMEAITEAYESGWSGHDLLYVQAQNMEMLWQDFSHKLGDQVLIPLNTYTNQFPEVRKKVEKRGRKLVDYDSQRHSFQNLQANAAKRRDDVKVTKGREQLEEAKRTYEVLNSELHDELPALFDSRVLFYVHNLQTLFSAEQLFHSETSKVFAELEAITDKLATDCQRGSYSKRNNGAPLPAPPHAPHAHAPALNGNAPEPAGTVQTPPATPPSPGWAPLAPPASPERPPAPATPPPPSPRATPGLNGAPPPPARRDQSAAADGDKPDDLYDIPVGSPVTPEKLNNNSEEKQEDIEQIETNNKTNEDQSKTDDKFDESQSKTENKTDESQNKTENKLNENQNKTENKFNESQTKIDYKPTERQSKTDNKSKDSQSKTYNISNDNQSKTEEVYDIPVGATLAGLPAGALYRVRATYRYTREDSDELSFDVGDVIRVVEYDDPDEQEEGWLMGIKETTNEKGMFPANFTRPI